MPRLVGSITFFIFIRASTFPSDKDRVAKIKKRAPSYEIVDGQLYNRSFSYPLLKCLLPNQVNQMIDEVHKGVCSAHHGVNILFIKILLQGYY